MKQYTHAFFDLDGTLTDSAEGITNSVSYALRKMGIEPPPAEALRVFIGPPLTESFMRVFGMCAEEAQRAVAYYREYYPVKGIFENRVYDGIPRLLEELTDGGIVCVLATSKPHVFASRILEHFGLDRYFAYLAGPELDGTRGEKHEVIAYAIEQMGLQAPSEIMMIGDRLHDVLGAKRNGIDCAGVLWGFGSEEELREAGAKYLCRDVGALAQILL